MPLGEQSLKTLAKTDDCAWLNGRTGRRQDSAAMKRLRTVNWANKRWKVYMGCWCSDTKQLLPDFESIGRELDWRKGSVTYYAVDMDKKSPTGMERKDRVEYVPTFILVEGDKEIGRIIETANPDMASAILALF